MAKITFQHSGKSVDADEGEWMYEVAAGCGCSSGCATSRTCSAPTSSTATSPPADADHTEVYLCGGRPMIESCCDKLTALGFPEEALRYERFF